MRINVKSGIRSAAKTLCPTCSHATVVRGPAESQEIVRCGHYTIDRQVEFPVVECTGYSDKNAISLYDMQQTAWVIDPNRRRFGFMRQDEWRDRNPGRDPLEGIPVAE